MAVAVKDGLHRLAGSAYDVAHHHRGPKAVMRLHRRLRMNDDLTALTITGVVAIAGVRIVSVRIVGVMRLRVVFLRIVLLRQAGAAMANARVAIPTVAADRPKVLNDMKRPPMGGQTPPLRWSTSDQDKTAIV